MIDYSFATNLKVLCEIIVTKDLDFSQEIRDIKLSAITDHTILSLELMDIIRNKLNEWEINIPSFENLTSKENALDTMLYLIETIQNDCSIELEKLENMKVMLNKENSIEKLCDCLELIPELLDELEKHVETYNYNIDRRINIHSSLKTFASNIFHVLSMIQKKLDNLQFKDSSTYKNLLENMQRLIHLSIVITTYPPRTIKKGTANKAGTHFKTVISSLIESEKLFSRESLNAYFLNEEDLKIFISSQKLKTDCKISFIVHNNTRTNSWELKNMLWNPSERHQNSRKKHEKITNNKAIIAFHFEADANPHLFSPFKVCLNLYSDTVISIVHTNQEIDALITLFWDDYFRIDGSAFLSDGTFKCNEYVLISEFTEAISKYFEKETTRGLTLSNIDFIKKKLFKFIPQGQMTFYLFANQPMQDSSMSFGTWIMSLIKLLKIPGTVELWTSDFIDGFMRKEVDGKFSELLPGTFSLRFSEKTAKIGVLVKMPNNSLDAWNPFSVDECRNKSLCDRLMDFHELKFIRNANGKVHSKEEQLSQFIQSKALDEGYTERGQLTRRLFNTIYADPIRDLDDESMNDPFIGSNFSGDSITDFKFNSDLVLE